MSLKKISISIVLVCCVLIFYSVDISSIVNRPKIKDADNSRVLSQNIEDEIITVSDREIETSHALLGTQSSSPNKRISNSTPFDEETIRDRDSSSSIQPDELNSVYSIKKGDTLHSIAKQLGISLEELLFVNQGINTRKIQIGNLLNLPPKYFGTRIKIKRNLEKKLFGKNLQFAETEKSSGTNSANSFKEQTPNDSDNHVQQPTEYEISSNFGNRIDPINKSTKFHSGIDIPRPIGTKVFSWSNGEVTRTGWLRGYGLSVDVTHSNRVKTRYAHLRDIDVRMGQKIDKGQILGKVGKTGRTTGANLHFEIAVAGKPSNPLKHLSEYNEIVENSIWERKNG